MATHKIPQNVEAEDKLIGPFTFKQFIFLIVASLSIMTAVLLFRVNPVLIIIPLPFIIVFLVLGLYHREDQPVETYLMAALNFFLKSRKRLWNPEGLIEEVKITAPKKMAPPQVKILSRQYGQLQRLARIVDTRGWAVKQPELTEQMDEHQLDNDDRLTVQAQFNQSEPLDIHASDDILDTYNNPRAQDFANLEKAAATQAKQTAIAKMQAAKQEVQPAKPLPTKVTYNPYPAIHQKVIDPALTVSQIASQINQQSRLPKTPPIS